VRRAYSFSGVWTVTAPASSVHALLVDLERYPEWWPQVLAVASLGPDDARVLCRSALPYTLDLLLHAVRRDPALLEVRMDGDLVGTASWRLTDLGEATRLDFSQEVTVGGWLAAASHLAEGILRWNHRRMMAGCVDGLSARLRSQHPPSVS
jgi:Polyketide cyclase / dehydrase and lipid transport